jgi:hypothetical protein
VKSIAFTNRYPAETKGGALSRKANWSRDIPTTSRESSAVANSEIQVP